MNEPNIGLCVRAELHLLSTEDGGRTTPIRDNYRPLCVVGDGNDEMMIGLMRVRLEGELAPGHSGMVKLEFHTDVADLARARLLPGAEFALAEGKRVVALAHVIDVG
jgi:translation elongation factor EF-Tu-like GTPase